MAGGRLRRSIRDWESWARSNPMYGIYRAPEFADPSSADVEAFYEVGRLELAALWAQLAELGVDKPSGGRAMDFGCGLGRLTRNLADVFDEVDGVDASTTMVEGARRQHEGRTDVRFHVNERDDLALFDDATFDAVISLITLQHIPPPAARRYLADMVRVLKPGGLLAVQLPERSAAPGPSGIGRITAAVRRLLGRGQNEHMHAHPEAEVRAVIEGAGATMIGTFDDMRAGDWGRSLLYVARR